MATIVLSVVGGIIAGPVGSAIGAVIGQQIDRVIFAPKGREGPRLSDLAVQTSRYGAPVPKLFGAVRVAGTVIWATDLKENRASQSNGKNRPRTTQYSYSSSFAVILSARAISGVGRIWADGNLLRGGAGDFKTQTGFRLYTGGEDQPVDPLIAAAEGIATCPAYRGCAYVVFEDFALADYGNRIPLLSFEVFADDAPVSIGAIVQTLSSGAIAGQSATLLGGLSAMGDSVRGVVEVLARAVPLSLIDDGALLMIREASGASIELPENDLGATATPERRPAVALARRAATAMPETLSIAYFDVTRDYQPGLQSARRDGASRRGDRIDLPVTISATTARGLAETTLTRAWGQRVSATVRVPWRYAWLRPGDTVTLPGRAECWRIAAMLFETMVIELRLVPDVMRSVTAAADPGRGLAQTDAPNGATTIVLIDLPPLDDVPAVTPQIAVAAAGASPGWRRAALLASIDGSNSFADAGSTAMPAVIGVTMSALPIATTALIDRQSTIDVMLISPEMVLSDADTAQLLGGANLAVIGRELIQFGRAVPIGNGVWRLSPLLRARRGTEAAMADHAIGERFVMIDRDSLAVLDSRFAVAGVAVMAVGIGDEGEPPVESLSAVGAAVRPLSPVHARAKRLASGDTRVEWIRRSRVGFRWQDAIDVPLGEEREAYRCVIVPAAGAPRERDVSEPRLIYSAAERISDTSNGATAVTIEIRQIGDRSISAPLIFPLSIT